MTKKNKDWGKFVEDVMELDEVVRDGKKEPCPICSNEKPESDPCEVCNDWKMD